MAPRKRWRLDQRIEDLFAMLGGRYRLRILELLAKGPLTTQELADLLDINESSVSRHLALLRRYQLIRGERHGKPVIYSVEKGRIEALLGTFRTVMGLRR